MTAFLLGLLPTIWPYLVAGVGMLAALFFVRRSGVKSAETKRLREEAKARHTADEIEDAIAGRTPDANREELRKWQPKP